PDGKPQLPRLTHNALVRTAPHEKGPLSSIVNTSRGGGYAPMVVVDDIGHPDAQPVESLATPPTPVPLSCDLPSFVGAQIVQVAQMIAELGRKCSDPGLDAFEAFFLVTNLKRQCREILSF